MTASPFFTNSRAYDRTGLLGTFKIPGLSAREYRLRVFHPRYLAMTSDSIAAGSKGVVLRYPKDELRRVIGHVTNQDGEPMPGIRVRIVIKIHESVLGTSWQWGTGIAETDRAGKFVLARVPAKSNPAR